MVGAGRPVVAGPLHRVQLLQLLHKVLIGGDKALRREEPPGGFKVPDLQHEPTPAVGGDQRAQKRDASVRQVKKQLALNLCQFGGMVEFAALGRVKNRERPGRAMGRAVK